jgi:hypothetical protein
MIEFYGKLLEAAKKVDPNATLTADPSGSAFININGKANYITSIHKADLDNYGITPDQIVSGYFLGNGLNLTPEQRTKVQASQLSALQSSMDQGGPAVVGQVQPFVEQLKAFWQTPAGQGIDPNAPPPAAPYVGTAPKLVTHADGTQGYINPDGSIHRDTTPPAPGIQSPFGTLGPSPAVIPVVKQVVASPIVRATPPPILRQATVPSLNNALAPQVNQPIQQPNPNYQRNLDRFRQNRWGRG